MQLAISALEYCGSDNPCGRSSTLENFVGNEPCVYFAPVLLAGKIAKDSCLDCLSQKAQVEGESSAIQKDRTNWLFQP